MYSLCIENYRNNYVSNINYVLYLRLFNCYNRGSRGCQMSFTISISLYPPPPLSADHLKRNLQEFSLNNYLDLYLEYR